MQPLRLASQEPEPSEEEESVPTVAMNGHDQIRTPAAAPGDPSTGILHRGWRFSLVMGILLALSVATFIGVLAGNHYSAKAATQNRNGALVQEIQEQGAQILALSNLITNRQSTGQANQALIQHELDILNDATIPGGKIYDAGQAAQSHAIAEIVSCVRAVVMNPSAPLPAGCPAS